jgi:hypothetical protein
MASSANSRSQGKPRPEHIVQAVHHLLEGLPVPDRYLAALVDLIEAEYVRRRRERRRRRLA